MSRKEDLLKDIDNIRVNNGMVKIEDMKKNENKTNTQTKSTTQTNPVSNNQTILSNVTNNNSLTGKQVTLPNGTVGTLGTPINPNNNTMQLLPENKSINRLKLEDTLKGISNIAENAGSGIARGVLEGSKFVNDIYDVGIDKLNNVSPILGKAVDTTVNAIPVLGGIKKSLGEGNDFLDKYNVVNNMYDFEAQNVENTVPNWARKGAELAPSIGQSLATAVATAGLGNVAGLGETLYQPTSKLGKLFLPDGITGAGILGSLGFGLSAGGSYEREGLQNRNMTKGQAVLYGLGGAGVETLTEFISLGFLKKGFKDLVAGSLKDALITQGINIIENGVQEGVTEYAIEGLADLVNGSGNWDNINERAMQSGIDGMLQALIMGGASLGMASCVRIVEKQTKGQQVSQEEINLAQKELEKAGKVLQQVGLDKPMTPEQALASQEYNNNYARVNEQLKFLNNTYNNANAVGNIFNTAQAEANTDLAQNVINEIRQNKTVSKNNMSNNINYQEKPVTSQNTVSNDTSNMTNNNVEIEKETQKRLDDITKVFDKLGYKVQIGEDDGFSNGQINSKDKVVTLSKTTLNGKGKVNVGTIGMHEFIHAFAKENPEGYNKLKQYLFDSVLTDENKSSLLNEYTRLYNEETGLNLNADELTEEQVADIVGQFIGNDTKYIEELANKEPTFISKLVDFLTEFIKKIKSIFRDEQISSDYFDDELILLESEVNKIKSILKKNVNKTSKNISKTNTTEYSLNKNVDNQGKKLTEAQQKRYKDVSEELRDEKGRLKQYYHGSNSANFTVFDPSYSDDGISLFFTDSIDVSNSYTKDDPKIIDFNNEVIDIFDSNKIFKNAYNEETNNFDENKIDNEIQKINDFIKNNNTELNGSINIQKIDDEFIDKLYDENIKNAFDIDDLQEVQKNNGKYIILQTYDMLYNKDKTNPLLDAIVPKKEGASLIIEDAGDIIKKSKEIFTKNNKDKANIGNTYAVYLNIKNPLVVEGKKEINEKLGKSQIYFYGYNATIKLKDENGNVYNEYSFDINDSKKINETLKEIGKFKNKDLINDIKKGIREYFGTIKEEQKTYNMVAKQGESMPSFKQYLNDLVFDTYNLDIENYKNNEIFTDNFSNWNKIPYKGEKLTTRQLAKIAKEEGHDGLVINDIYDIGGYGMKNVSPAQIVVAFNADQVKDINNQNPTNSKDIRYSVEKDSEGNKLSKEQIDYNKNNKIRDEEGRLYSAYHGTPASEPFYTFDAREGDSAFGDYKFGDVNVNFFTTSKDTASQYTEFGYDNAKANERNPKLNLPENVYNVYPYGEKPLIIDSKETQNWNSINSPEIAMIRKELAIKEFDEIANEYYDDDVLFDIDIINDMLDKYNLEIVIDEEQLNDNESGYEVDLYSKFDNSFYGMRHSIDTFYNIETVGDLFNDNYFFEEVSQEDENGLNVTMSTNELVKLIIAGNENNLCDYDSVIIKNVLDNKNNNLFNAPATDIITLTEQNPAKDVSNKKPTKEINDRRYSLKKKYKDGIAETKLADDIYYGKKINTLKNEKETLISKISKEANDDKLADRIQDAWDKAIENNKKIETRKVKEYKQTKNHLIDNVKEIDKVFNNPKEKNFFPENWKQGIAEIRSLIDIAKTDKINNANLKLTSLKEAYEDLSKQDAKYTPEEYAEMGLDVDLYDDEITAILNKLDGIPVREMTLEEIKDLDNAISGILYQKKNANKAFFAGKQMKVNDIIENKIQPGIEWRQEKDTRNKVGDFLEDELFIKALRPEHFFNMLGMKDFFNNELLEGQDRQINIARNFKDVYDENLTKELEKKLSDGNRRKFILDSGKTIELTTQQMMSLYEAMKDEDNKRHILEGGIKPSTIDGSLHKTTQKIYRVTENDVNNILKKLSKDEIEFAELLGNHINDYGKKISSEAFIRYFGYDKNREGFYFPISVASETLDKDFGQHGNQVKNTTMGIAHDRNSKASNGITLGNITDVYYKYANDIASFAGYGDSIRTLVKIANYKNKDTGYTLVSDLNGRFGNKTYDVLKRFIYDLQQVNLNQNIDNDTIANKLSGAGIASQIAFNLSSTLKQPVAIVKTINAGLDPKYVAKGLAYKTVRQNTVNNEMLRYSPIAYLKHLGYSEANQSRGLSQSSLETGNKGKKIANKIKDISFAGMEMADNYTWGAIWQACKYEYADKNNKKVTKLTDADLKKVNERFREIIADSQVVDSILHKGDTTKHGNSLEKIETVYMNEPSSQVSMIYDGFNEYKRTGSKKKLARAITSTVLNTTLETAITIMMSKLRGTDDDDDKDKETLEKIGDFFKQVPENILGNLYYVNTIISLAEGFEKKDTVWENPEKLISDVVSLIDYKDTGKKTKLNLTVDALDRLTRTIFGVSFNNLKRDFFEVPMNLFAKDNYELQYKYNKLWTNPSNSNAKTEYYDLLYEAKKNNKKQYNTILADLTNTLVENDTSDKSKKEKTENIKKNINNAIKDREKKNKK